MIVKIDAEKFFILINNFTLCTRYTIGENQSSTISNITMNRPVFISIFMINKYAQSIHRACQGRTGVYTLERVTRAFRGKFYGVANFA